MINITMLDMNNVTFASAMINIDNSILFEFDSSEIVDTRVLVV